MLRRASEVIYFPNREERTGNCSFCNWLACPFIKGTVTARVYKRLPNGGAVATNELKENQNICVACIGDVGKIDRQKNIFPNT